MTIAYKTVNSHFWLLGIIIFHLGQPVIFFPSRKSLRQTLKIASLHSHTAIHLELLLANMKFHSIYSLICLLSLSTKTLIEASELHCYRACRDH